MRLSLLRCVLVLAALLVLGLTGPARAQISPLYLTAGDDNTNAVIQNGALSFTFAQAANPTNTNGEYAIAVNGDVRTLGNDISSSPLLGARYTLAGTDTGTRYPYPTATELGLYDGTTDGTFLYSVSFYDGNVFRFDADWSNPVLLFATSFGLMGITYDATDATLWISEYSGDGGIRHYTLDGTLLGEIDTPFNRLTSLALDPADGTLWFGSQNTPGTFYQYSRAGALLNTVTVPSITGLNTLGGEFNFVAPAAPEPADLISDLIDDAVDIEDLPDGIKNSFVSKLEAALAALEAGDTATACQSLQDFIDHALAQRGKKLPAAQADALIEDARAIRTELGCS